VISNQNQNQAIW